MNASALAVAGPPQHAFGGGSFLLAILVLAALGFGAVRLTARRRAGSTKPDSSWPPAPPAPPEPLAPPASSKPLAPLASSEPSTPPVLPAPPPAPGEIIPSAPPRPRRAVPSPDVGWAVETDGLTKRFGSNVAVDGVELRVPRGSAFGYLGPNGAGKTRTSACSPPPAAARRTRGSRRPWPGWVSRTAPTTRSAPTRWACASASG